MAERVGENPVPPSEELLLAIESATKRASVALARGHEIVAEREAASGDHHAEQLLPMIDALLASAGAKLEDVGAFAVSIGPGAFTSLRIGLATLKGLAFDGDAPVAAVSTLEAVAHAALRAGRVDEGELCVPLLDARRGAFYAAGYRLAEGDAAGSPGRLVEVIEDGVASPDELGARLEGAVRLVGEGAALFGDEIAAAAGSANVAVDAREPVWPDARAVVALGRAMLEAGEGRPAAGLVPRYLRRTQAEEQRAARAAE